MTAHVSVDQLKAVWESLLPKMGVLHQRGAPVVTTDNEATVVSIPLVFANGRLVARIVSNAGGEVIGLLIQPDAAPPPPARADLPSREVTFGASDRALPGTLLLPKASSAKQPYPAVGMVHGSGPPDRHATGGRPTRFPRSPHGRSRMLWACLAPPVSATARTPPAGGRGGGARGSPALAASRTRRSKGRATSARRTSQSASPRWLRASSGADRPVDAYAPSPVTPPPLAEVVVWR